MSEMDKLMKESGNRKVVIFSGGFLLIFGGSISAILMTTYWELGIVLFGVLFVLGLTILTMDFVVGYISGAHLNPVVFNLLALFFTSFSASSVSVNFNPYPYQNVYVSDNTTGNSYVNWGPKTNATYDFDLILVHAYSTNVSMVTYATRTSGLCDGQLGSAAAAVANISQLMKIPRTLPWTNQYGTDGPALSIQDMNPLVVEYQFYCWDRVNNTFGNVTKSTYNGEVNVIDPPTAKRVCSLNEQHLNFNFNSTSLNVNGVSQDKSLVVQCTSGDARDYKVSLTGTRVENGRLSFGNGASAQISLNGSTLTANGSAIPLGSLSVGSLSVRATLVGTATGSGTTTNGTTTNGVLVLESQ